MATLTLNFLMLSQAQAQSIIDQLQPVSAVFAANTATLFPAVLTTGPVYPPIEIPVVRDPIE